MKPVFTSKFALTLSVAIIALVPFGTSFAVAEEAETFSWDEYSYGEKLFGDGEGGIQENVNLQANAPGGDHPDTYSSKANNNSVSADLIDGGDVKIADDVDVDIAKTDIDASTVLNSADNAVVVGVSVVYDDNTTSLDPSDGPIVQDNIQVNLGVGAEASANRNDVRIDTKTKSSAWPGNTGNDLTIRNTSIKSTAIGNTASNAFVGDVGDAHSDGSFGGQFYLNTSVQANIGNSIKAETLNNDVIIDPRGNYSWFNDISISNTKLAATAIGNDATDTVGLETDGRGSGVISQVNVQLNLGADIDARANNNRIEIDPDGRAIFGDGDISLTNNSIRATAVGNRATTRLGGPDLGGIKK